MTWKLAPFLVLAFVGAAAGDDRGDRANLAGTWQSQDNAETWLLENTSDKLHVTRMQNGEKVMDFECNTGGRECDLKESGHDAKVSMWYSGPKLVIMETKGSEVVKRRLNAAQGDNLEMEVISIVPDRKPELLKFVRRVQSAGAVR